MFDGSTIPLEQTAAAWDAASLAYAERISPRNAPYSGELLRVLAPTPGTRFLDVACGTGIVAARAAFAGCDVVAIDLSERMIELLASAALRFGLPIRAERMDAQQLAFADASFEFAASLFGVGLFVDRAAGLREMRRVLAPGGRAAIGAWHGPERVEILTPLLRAMREALAAAPAPAGPPLIYSMADEDSFRAELVAAGFRDVTFHDFEHPLTFDDIDEYWLLLESAVPASSERLARLSEPERRAVRAALGDDLREHFGTGPVSLAAAARIAVASA